MTKLTSLLLTLIKIAVMGKIAYEIICYINGYFFSILPAEDVIKVIAPIVEEIVKFFFGIYGTFGFAILESIDYANRYSTHGFGFYHVFILRLVITVPMHLLTAKLSSRGIKFMPLAMVIHMSFNSILSYGVSDTEILFLGLYINISLIAISIYSKITNKNKRSQ